MAKGGGRASGKAQAKTAAPKPQGEPKTKRTPGDEQTEIEERVEQRDIDIDAPVPMGAVLKSTNPAIGKKTIVEKIVIIKQKRGPDKVETIPGEATEGEGGGMDGEGDEFPEKEEHDRDRQRDKPLPEKIVAHNRGAPYNAYTQLQHAHAAANVNSPSRMLATAAALGRMGQPSGAPQPQMTNRAPVNQMPIIIPPAFARRAITTNGPRPPVGQLRTITDVSRLGGMQPDQISIAGRRPHGLAPLSARLAADLPSPDQMPGSTLDTDAVPQFGAKPQQSRQGAKFGAGPAGRAGGPSGPAAAAGGSGAGGGPR